MFKFIAKTTQQYAESAMRNRRISARALPMLTELISKTTQFRWRSDFLDRNLHMTPERIDTIVDGIFYDKKMQREMKRVIQKVGGIDSNRFWDVYLRRADAVMSLSDAYLEYLQLVNSTLPITGHITDLNCGSGALSASLIISAPDRQILAMDSNPRAAIQTKRVLKHVFALGAWDTKALDLTNPEFKLPPTDALILKDSLFLIETTESKVQWLEHLGKFLKPGGTLLIAEPKPSLQKQSTLRAWLERIVKSSTTGKYIFNEYDVAMFLDIQRRLLLGAAFPFATTQELMEIAKLASFEVKLVRDSLYGHYSVLVLTKVEKVRPEPIIRYHGDRRPKSDD